MQKIIEYLNKNNVEFEKIDENEIGIFPEEDGESEISIIKDEWGYNIWNNPYYSPIEEEISEGDIIDVLDNFIRIKNQDDEDYFYSTAPYGGCK